MSNALKDLFNFSIPPKPLDNKHLELLLSLLKHPGITANDAFKSAADIFTDEKPVDYKTIWRRFDNLYKLNLVKKMQGFKTKESDIRAPIPYELSLHGILYILLNYPSNLSQGKLIFYLSYNYPLNILFTEFLHSLINQDTLLDSRDEKLSAIVYTYLKNICKDLQNITKSHNDISCDVEGYILTKIFNWPRDENLSSYKAIPFNDHDLRSYLKNKFDWPWIDECILESNYIQNSIDIYKPNKSDETIRLLINEKENNALLMMNDEKIDEFVIIKNDLFSNIHMKTGEKKEDLLLQILRRKYKWHKIEFRKNIRRQRILLPYHFPNSKIWYLRKFIKNQDYKY